MADGAQGAAHTKGTPVFRRAVFSGAASAAALICLAVAGCSSSASQPTTPTTTTVTATPSAAGASSGSNTPAVSTSSPAGPVSSAVSCATSSLNVKQGLAQGYAGGVYEVIVFTNTSNSPCSLLGYPGVSLVTGSHTQIGLAAKRSTTSGAVKLITLAPGASANATLQIVDALNFPSSTCGPTKAAALKVYPPNQTAPVYLANTSEACTKSVQTMNIGPVQAGSGGST
jgi:Protein of unknown function (DUF4232)